MQSLRAVSVEANYLGRASAAALAKWIEVSLPAAAAAAALAGGRLMLVLLLMLLLLMLLLLLLMLS